MTWARLGPHQPASRVVPNKASIFLVLDHPPVLCHLVHLTHLHLAGVLAAMLGKYHVSLRLCNIQDYCCELGDVLPRSVDVEGLQDRWHNAGVISLKFRRISRTLSKPILRCGASAHKWRSSPQPQPSHTHRLQLLRYGHGSLLQ